MPTKNQKLLKLCQRKYLIVFAALYFISILSALIVANYQAAYAIPMPPRDQVITKAENYCKNVTAITKEDCQNAYGYGYTAEKSLQEQCGIGPDDDRDASSLGTKKTQCLIAYEAGVRQRNKDGVTQKADGTPFQTSTPSSGERKIAERACKDVNGNEAKEGCIQGFLGAANGYTKERACRGTSGAKKAACEEMFDKRDKGLTSGSAAADDEERVDPDCSSSLKSILSWIACPIIDMGASFTDFVFKDFVRPMLENVPISTKPDSGSYIAWQGFRLLGNVLLVGTLLAIVYGQTRGGGGGR